MTLLKKSFMGKIMTNKIIDKFLMALGEWQGDIAVIGDILLDEYQDVDVTRISPEYPIPVIKKTDNKILHLPGGAGNVASQFEKTIVNTTLFGIVNPHYLHSIGNKSKVCINGSVVIDCLVPIKCRLVDRAKNYQVCRIDEEKKNYGLSNSEIEGCRRQLLKQLRSSLQSSEKKYKVIVCSDYDKGVFDEQTSGEIIRASKASNCITIVDPKNDPLQWSGCDILKPNTEEAEKFCQMFGIFGKTEEKYTKLRKICKCRTLIVTGGKEASYIVGKTGTTIIKPISDSRPVRSVIGAGDCFTAYLAMAMGCGLSVEQSTEIAQLASSEYVRGEKNEAICPSFLFKHLDKITNVDKVKNYRKATPKTKWTLSNGVYDIIHSGHLKTIKESKKAGDILVIGINDDESVRRLKGPTRPINPLETRMNFLANLDLINFIVPFSEDTPLSLIKNINVDIIVKGSDYKVDEVVGHDIADVLIVPLVEGLSTTKTINSIYEHSNRKFIENSHPNNSV